MFKIDTLGMYLRRNGEKVEVIKLDNHLNTGHQPIVAVNPDGYPQCYFENGVYNSYESVSRCPNSHDIVSKYEEPYESQTLYVKKSEGRYDVVQASRGYPLLWTQEEVSTRVSSQFIPVKITEIREGE